MARSTSMSRESVSLCPNCVRTATDGTGVEREGECRYARKLLPRLGSVGCLRSFPLTVNPEVAGSIPVEPAKYNSKLGEGAASAAPFTLPRLARPVAGPTTSRRPHGASTRQSAPTIAWWEASRW
jgi:hypothetical protein